MTEQTEIYVPPTLRAVEKESYEIPFIAPALLTGQNGYSSGSIDFPFKVTKIRMYFPDNAVYGIDVYWLTATTPAISTVAMSEGQNLFSPFSPVVRFIGHADIVTLYPNRVIEATHPYIKMHVVNNNAYAITLMGIVTIRRV